MYANMTLRVENRETGAAHDFSVTDVEVSCNEIRASLDLSTEEGRAVYGGMLKFPTDTFNIRATPNF